MNHAMRSMLFLCQLSLCLGLVPWSCGPAAADDGNNVDATIRRLIRTVDPERISKHVFYLAKDPLPYRKLNLTLPGHAKNTLCEADDYLAGVLEIARVLAPYPSESTIRFLLCNEEHTPWTSKTAAQKAKARGDNIVAVFNLDGIAAKTAEQTAAGKKTNVTAYTKPEGKRLAELMGEVNARYSIGLEQRTAERPQPGDDDGSFVMAGYPAAVINIGSWPYGDPNYHAEGDAPEASDVENAAMTVQATLAALMTIDRGL